MTPRIAIVEDNLDNQMLLRVLLEDSNDLDMYGSGPAALLGMPRSIPDLVLLDISLPGMDGTEVLGWIRSHPAMLRLPVVAVTANAMTGDREKYLGLGFDAYLSKPITDEQQLLRLIKRLLALRAA
jgi:CheY-like chemotaxis protein